jgi:hypothetical protein
MFPKAVAAYAAAGLDHEDGLLPGGSPATALRAHDRLLTLDRAARGGLALQCGNGNAGAAARTLATGLLIGREGFSAAEAEAWLRLVCPAVVWPPKIPEPMPELGPSGLEAR